MTQPVRLPGVLVQRRALLGLPALGALSLFPDTRPFSVGTDEEPLDFEQFTAHCVEVAAGHIRGGRIAADALLHGIAALGARLRPATVEH